MALQQTGGKLAELVQDFVHDAGVYRQLIRECLEKDRAAFLEEAIEILRRDRESRGAHYVIHLLIAENLLFDALSDPGVDPEEAASLVKVAIRVNPMLDVLLARRLAEVAISDPNASGLGQAGRVLDVLSGISDGTRILPSLMRLLRNANPYLRSKAVLMIGKGSKSVPWVGVRMAESDPRVRANAVEGLWGVDTAEARELLQLASHDASNRVAANAVLGLYWLGEVGAIGELVKMGGHASSGFRMSAAWAMGEAGDPRFGEALGKLLADTCSGVRKRAFASMAQLRSEAALIGREEKWELIAAVNARERSKVCRKIAVTVVPKKSRVLPKFLPTQFLVSEDGQPVLAYKVTERPLAEAMSVVFVFPRPASSAPTPWVEAALECLERKRPTDLWCVVPYLTSVSDDNDGAELALPAYSAQQRVLEANLKSAAIRAECSDLWSSLWRAVRPDSAAPRGKRHLIVVAPAGIGRIAGHGLIASVLSTRTSVQVISAERNDALENFCTQAGGNFVLAQTPEEIGRRVRRAYLSLLAQYDVSYRPSHDGAANIKLRLHADGAFGETTIGAS